MHEAAGPDVETDDPGPFGSSVDALDATIDSWFDPLRANPVTDRIFYVASTLGDFSLVWHLIGAYRGVLPGAKPRDAARLSAVMGIESLVVNQGIKRLFGRVRPVRPTDSGELHIRQPVTSSFPSGHASAALTAAAVLSRKSHLAPVYYAAAAVVALSRVHVRMHHPSDVAAGAVTGVVLGRLAVRILDRLDR